MFVEILGTVPAGFPSPAGDYMENDIDLQEYLISRRSSTFFFRVTGESMIEAHIPSGALLIIDKSIIAKSGHIVLAIINGEFTVKRLHKVLDRVSLLPANKKFKPIIVDELSEFKIWGVVTFIITDAKTV